MKWLIIIIYALLSSGGLTVVKYGVQNEASLFKFFGFLDVNFYTILGIVMYGISFLIYMFLISKYNLIYIVPVTTAISYLFIFVVSIIFIKEPLNWLQIFGYFIVMLGVVFINVK